MVSRTEHPPNPPYAHWLENFICSFSQRRCKMNINCFTWSVILWCQSPPLNPRPVVSGAHAAGWLLPVPFQLPKIGYSLEEEEQGKQGVVWKSKSKWMLNIDETNQYMLCLRDLWLYLCSSRKENRSRSFRHKLQTRGGHILGVAVSRDR